MAHLLEVRDLNVWFTSPGRPDVHAVRGASLALDSRERAGLVGESGCGKSTTILAMMGLLPSNAVLSGQVLLNGVDILAAGDRSMRPHRWRDHRPDHPLAGTLPRSGRRPRRDRRAGPRMV